MTDKEKKVEKKDRFVVTEIATQTAPVIMDTETQERYDIHFAICRIMNDLTDLKKQLA
jgi:hypothetical protein